MVYSSLNSQAHFKAILTSSYAHSFRLYLRY